MLLVELCRSEWMQKSLYDVAIRNPSEGNWRKSDTKEMQ